MRELKRSFLLFLLTKKIIEHSCGIVEMDLCFEGDEVRLPEVAVPLSGRLGKSGGSRHSIDLIFLPT